MDFCNPVPAGVPLGSGVQGVLAFLLFLMSRVFTRQQCTEMTTAVAIALSARQENHLDISHSVNSNYSAVL